MTALLPTLHIAVTLSGFRTVEQVGIQLRSNETFNAGTLVLAPG